MDAKARNFDIFKTIVLLFLILLLVLFIRFFYGISLQGGLTVPQSMPASQPAATLESIPTAANTAQPNATEPAVSTQHPFVASSGLPDCSLAAPARISGVGARVRVTNALIPLRTRPSVPSSSFLGPLPIGTELEVVSLPVCEPYLEGANLWWNVRTLSGKTGWAAEASAKKPAFYYLEEIK